MTPADAVRAACAALENAARADSASARMVVGIDGAGGAGKSTLARGLGEVFKGRVSVVGCDDFYRPLINAQFSPEQAYDNYFAWRRLRDEALIPLRNGNQARYQRYDWGTDRLAEWIEVEPREFAVVEGVFSTRPELRPLIDVAIFIETPRDLRIARMTARGQGSTAWMAQWMAAEDWYLEQIAPQRRADLVIEGF
jgi:uridine kinase